MLVLFLGLLDDDSEKNLFEKIYNDNYQLMYYTSFQILKNEQDAENAVHDSFMSFLNHFSKYKKIPEEKMTGLCITIVKNKCFNVLREQKHYSECDIDNLYLADTSIETNPELKVLCNNEERNALSIISQLPHIYREVLMMRYYYGFSRGVISKTLGIPIRTVDKRIYTAKEKARRLLQDERN